MKETKALFCISSLGLGHVTRTVSLIETYLLTHDVHVVCTGNALSYLKEELKGKGVTFYDLRDYPAIERGKGFMFYLYLVVDSINTIWTINKEHRYIKELCKKISPQFIVSDGRYGSHVKGIPSLIISHQISFIMPRGLGIFQGVADYFNYKTFKKFDEVLIPDYEDEDNNLAGKLSHNKMLSKLKHRYVGVLSSLKKKAVVQEIDFLFTVSGYLMEHKADFISILIENAKKLPGKKVFILGNAGEGSQKTTVGSDIEVISSVSGEERQSLYNKSKFVISRSGYTTVMDLVELEIPGFLIPTPGQTEQEYLAQYLGDKKFFLVSGKKFDLSSLGSQKEVLSFRAPWTTSSTVKLIRSAIVEKIEKRP